MSNEEHPRYHQNRRLQQARMQRQVRRSQRRLNQLRSLWKLFIIVFLIALGVGILKMPQWRLHKNAFDSLNSPALEILNNHIVPAPKILSALRRNQVNTRPIFLVKTDNLRQGIGKRLLNYVKEKYDKLTLNVYEKNVDATLFYVAMGFKNKKIQIDEDTGEKEYIMEWEK